ncbi:MAG: hypothetical protein JXR18_00055 [Neptuniibacter sp.]
MKKISQALSVSAYLTGILILAGCSSVADYQQPITDMNESINQSVATIEYIDSELTAAQNKRWRELIRKEEAFLLEADDSCALGTKSCSLVVIAKGSDQEQTFPVVSMMPNAAEALSGLKGYTEGLKEIVDADSAASIIFSTNAALASASKIELEIAKAKGQNSSASTIEAYSSPLSNSFSWVISQYIDREKVKALAAATKQAQPIIEGLANYYDTAASAAASLKASEALDNFLKAQSRFDDARIKNSQEINQYLAAVRSYDTALKAGSSEPMKIFLKAHTALNQALNSSEDVSLADAIAAIKELKKHSEDFKGLVLEFIQITKEQEAN